MGCLAARKLAFPGGATPDRVTSPGLQALPRLEALRVAFDPDWQFAAGANGGARTAKPTTLRRRGRRDFCAEHACSCGRPCKRMAGPLWFRKGAVDELLQPPSGLERAYDTTRHGRKGQERRTSVPPVGCPRRHSPRGCGHVPPAWALGQGQPGPRLRRETEECPPWGSAARRD